MRGKKEARGIEKGEGGCKEKIGRRREGGEEKDI